MSGHGTPMLFPRWLCGRDGLVKSLNVKHVLFGATHCMNIWKALVAVLE